MIKEIKEYDFGMVEALTTSKRWGENFRLQCDIKNQIPYAEKCLEYLDSLPADLEKRLAKYLVRYYKDMQSCCSEEELEEMGPIDESNVLDHIHIGSVIVGNECRTDRIEFHVEGECGWEPEHGLEITISDNKILYVGPFEDNGPNTDRLQYQIEQYGYYREDSDPKMSYVDKEE